jgi:calcium/proton exchanger cax
MNVQDCVLWIRTASNFFFLSVLLPGLFKWLITGVCAENEKVLLHGYVMQATAQVSSGLLLMAVMGLLFPATLHATKTEMYSGESELILSRFSSIVMLVAYTAYLYFQLRSHRELYDPEGVKFTPDPHFPYW